MAMIPPPWLQAIVRLTAPNVHPQIQVVLEAYAMCPDYACSFVCPTLECADCGRAVMLQESRTERLRVEWWEVVQCHHERGHHRCRPVYRPHSRSRCRDRQVAHGRSGLPWVFDGITE